MATIGGNLLQRTRCPYFRDVGCRLQQARAGLGLRRDRRRQPLARGARHERPLHRHPPVRPRGRAGRARRDRRVRGPTGERTFPVDDSTGCPATRRTSRRARAGRGDRAVARPGGPDARRSHYLKVRDRASFEFALVSAAVALHVEDGVIREARVALGGVGTKPWRVRACEAALAGKAPDRSALRGGRPARAGRRAPALGQRFKIELMQRTMVRALEMAGELA